MRRSLTISGAVLLGLLGTVNAEEMDKKECNMLFIGNSFTMRHELPKLFATLAEEGNPGSKIQTEIVGYGGRNLFHQWEMFRSYNRLEINTMSSADMDLTLEELNELSKSPSAPDFFTQFWDELHGDEFYANFHRKRARGWDGDRRMIKGAIFKHKSWMKKRSEILPKFDYIVLQSWRDVAAAPDKGYFKYAAKFAEAAKAVDARTVLYLTAPYAHNKAQVAKAVAREQAVGECRAAQAFAKTVNAIVVPVPLAITLAQESTEPVARTLTYRYVNDNHPNNTMAYLTACTFYAAVYGKSPEGLTFNKVSENKVQNIHGEKVSENSKEAISTKVNPDGGPLDTVFTDEERIFLQRTAWEAVKAFRTGQF